MITIDGSMGGGAVVRLAVGLSAATGRDVHLTNIRENRDTPGLGHQHLAGVRAVAELTNAETEGVTLGSTTLLFEPGEVSTQSVQVHIPTAGSAALALQPLMIAATAVDGPVQFRISGGATAGKWAPTIHYLRNVTLPVLARSGFAGSIEVERHGFYPHGGAAVAATFDGSGLDAIEATERGAVERIRGVSWASRDLWEADVAERQQRAARETLLDQLPEPVDVHIDMEAVDTLGPGSAVQLWAETSSTRLGGAAIGERGVPAEAVGADAGQALAYAVMTDAPLDAYMSDQIIPFLALAGGEVRVRDFTDHVMTALAVSELFTPYTLAMERERNLLTAH